MALGKASPKPPLGCPGPARGARLLRAKSPTWNSTRCECNMAPFAKQGYFIGSGVIEAGCKSVVGQRCKLSGMHWSVAGVDNVLDLRCLLTSGALWDQFWQNRQEQKRTPLTTAA